MSDIKPNIEIGLKQLEVQLGEMRLSLQRQELRLLEIEEEKVRIADNTKATLKEIVQLEENIAKLRSQVDKAKVE